jgi:hypothetical protein
VAHHSLRSDPLMDMFLFFLLEVHHYVISVNVRVMYNKLCDDYT